MSLELTPIIDGPAHGHVLFFVQGWPDDASVWDRAVKRLQDRYRCVRVSLPGSGGVPSERAGYDTDEVVEALARCIRSVSSEPVTLIAHDWGAFWGYILHHRHPELIKRVAGLDIAPHITPSPKEAAMIVAYQGLLAGAFLVGGSAGDWLTRGMARVLGAPGRSEGISHAMNFPYRNSFRDLRNGAPGKQTRGYRPEVPLLYVYGKRKPFMFHSPRWLEHVERVGGTVIGLDCGHWVQLHPEFDATLDTWLQRTA